MNDMTHSQYSSLSRSATLAFLSAAVLAACGGGTSGSDTISEGLSASDTSSGVTGTDTLSSIERYRRNTTVTTAAATTTTTSTAPASTTSTASAAWTECAEENGTCSFSGTRSVKYGVASAYVTRAFTSTVACSNATFGDPAVGQWKKCWVDSSSAAVTPAPTTATAPLVVATAPLVVATAPATPATATPATTVSVPSGVSWTGLSAAMWAEVDSQRAAFGDLNDCKARVDAVPTTGTTINPGADINAALASSNVVILAGGTYNLSSPVNVPAGKKLVGAPGQTVTLNAVGADRGVQLGNGATLANVIVDGAATFGVLPFSSAGYSNNTLIYQVSVRKTGFYSSTSDGSIGIFISGGAANNCVVSSEALDSWNVIGSDGSTTSVTAHGGNSDGIDLSNGAHDNTLIDFHSLRNGDDCIDMWNGGVAFMYFSTANDNGKTTGKALTGDGNGIKLGIGSVAHKLYKTTASNNKSHGFNLNANTMQPVLVLSTASANGDTDYGNGLTPP